MIVPGSLPIGYSTNTGRELALVDQDKSSVENRLTYLESQMLLRTQWMGTWAEGTYEDRQQVIDQGWLAIANKQTEDRPAPQPQGEAAWYYSPDNMTTEQATAKTIIFGNRYTWPTNGYLNKYRIKVAAGDHYVVYTVYDPLGVAAVTVEADFVATTTGWVEFGLPQTIITAGTTFDLIVKVNEPDPTPTVWVDQWDYDTPNNPAPPASGEIIHANSAVTVLSVHYTSQTIDRTADLQALTVGDIIDRNNSSWAIQSISDQGTYINFGISPGVQDSPDGVGDVSFETVTATPISYGREVDKWLGDANASGLYIADGAYEDIVPDDNAYGVDLEIQQAYVSPDWDLQSNLG